MMTRPHPADPLPYPVVMVAHGPSVFDAGDISRLICCLCPRRTVVAGVMARTAAEESGLPVTFDPRPPSHAIRDAEFPAFLVNRGKTPASGRIFGGIIAARLQDRGLVHLECSDNRVICWDNGDLFLARDLAKRTGAELEVAVSPAPGDPGIRQIRGCLPGEPVYVNGIVIGRATAEVVELRQSCGKIEPVTGLVPKPHGLEKLRTGSTDLRSAWCKSGAVRSAAARHGSRSCLRGQIIVIDHCGHGIYTRIVPDCCGVLAIGDDTTAVCGHICSHRGIPVLGVTDHDADTILPASFAPGSVVLDSRPSRDDDIGREIAAMVPEAAVCWDDWVREVLLQCAGRVTVVSDLRKEGA